MCQASNSINNDVLVFTEEMTGIPNSTHPQQPSQWEIKKVTPSCARRIHAERYIICEMLLGRGALNT
jgi:hypothetical protein